MWIGDEVSSMKISPDELYSVAEVAQHLQIHVDTVRRMIRRGDLEALRMPNKYRVPGRSLLDLLSSWYMEASPALREPPSSKTQGGKPRQRRAPLRPRPPGTNAHVRRREQERLAALEQRLQQLEAQSS